METHKTLVLLGGMSMLAVLFAGCGGGGSGGAVSGTLSCDINPADGASASEHVCIASVGYGKTAGDSDGTKANCTTSGGKIGTGCDLTGAIAGCQGTGAGGGSYITFTYWYYSGTVESVQALCEAGSQTLVLPTGAQQSGTGGTTGGGGNGNASGGAGGSAPGRGGESLG